MILITHNKNRKQSTLLSTIKALWLLWSKDYFDIYELKFSKECLEAPFDSYNKILGTSQYLKDSKLSLSLAWKPDRNGNILVVEMFEENEEMDIRLKAIVKPNELARVFFTKSFRLAINTPCIGGDNPADKKYTYQMR